MRIDELCARLNSGAASSDQLILGAGDTATPIHAITADSRAVVPGAIFAALPGLRADGRDFIPAALAAGAAAILAPAGTSLAPDATACLLTAAAPRRALARIASLLAGPQPATIAAITGTNGKTSTADFCRQIFSLSGQRAASLGTLGLIAPGHPGGSGLTTPDPVALAAQLATIAAEGVTHLAMEASSHGIEQARLDGVILGAAAFSNLTRDHLDYHGTMAAYRAAKLRLFDTLLPPGSPAIVNADMDAETLAALRAIAHTRHLRLITTGEAAADWRLLHTRPLPHGQALSLSVHGQPVTLELPLPGRFQADNALLAAATAEACGIARALDHLPHLRGVRGRMELAAHLDHGAAAYVDYAHTPDALERLLQALRPHTQGRLICLFGAGGDRDPGKRPLMGGVVARLADIAIITDDNPRSENPEHIRAAIRAASPGAIEIADRRTAIAEALAMLRPGDVLAVAGKGHEQGQIIGASVLPFDDASAIRDLAGLSGGQAA